MNLGLLAFVVPASSLIAGSAIVPLSGQIKPNQPNVKIQKLLASFSVEKSNLTHSGRSKFFVLEPNHKFELKGRLETKRVHVLKETLEIEGVETRVVEERSFQAGKLIRLTREYYALDRKTKDLYAFGRDVDLMSDGKVVGHEGSWKAGVNGAKIGLAIPGNPTLGMYFRMANAPGVNQTEAKVMSLSDSTTAAGRKFTGVMRVEETSPTDKSHKVIKLYGQWTGIIREGDMIRQQHVPDK